MAGADAGVHARGQVASFVWPEQYPFEEYRILSALNAMTPGAIHVLSAESQDLTASTRAFRRT